ncbi:MAG: hypothetical protein JJE03_01835 [Peptostreptococcaceae bacterium]|nr:hypothetical protein [Peptostreptococcaceae bacterium]
MKNLITTIASILILMVYLLQFINNQQIHNTVVNIDREINCIKEISKQEGYLTEKNRSELLDKLSDIANCDTGEIVITGTDEKKYRGELIHIYVKLPIKNLIVANEFFGIDDIDNQGFYKFDFYTTSEHLEREN